MFLHQHPNLYKSVGEVAGQVHGIAIMNNLHSFMICMECRRKWVSSVHYIHLLMGYLTLHEFQHNYIILLIMFSRQYLVYKAHTIIKKWKNVDTVDAVYYYKLCT